MTRGRPAYTLVELMVVLAIISILIAMSTTGLMYLRRSAAGIDQANDLRQIGLAWSQYNVDSRGKFVAGWLSRKSQQDMRLVLTYPDDVVIPPAPTFDNSLPETAGPWTWRLAHYLDNDLEPMLDQDMRDIMPITDYAERGQHIAFHPAFAYNGWYVGGHYEISHDHNRPTLEFSRAPLADRTYKNVVAESLGRMQHPTSTFVFMPGAFMAKAGPWGISDADSFGPDWFEVTPPILADQQLWTQLSMDDIETLRDDVAIPRLGLNQRIPVFFADGHVSTQSMTDLMNQSHWIDAAKQVEDIPAGSFTHEAR